MCAMQRYEHEVFACAPQASDVIKQQLALWDIQYQHLDLQRTGLNPIKDIIYMFGLVKLFRLIRPDVILSYTVKPVIYGSIAARIASVPSINSMITGLGYIFINDSFQNKFLNYIVRLLYKLALSQTQLVFFQNIDDLSLFRKLSLLNSKTEQVLINGSGVDLDHFHTTLLPNKLSFLLIARLIKEKGVREYVHAARIIRKKFPQIRFNLVGWIDETPSAISLEELTNWKKEGVIHYLGRLDDVRPAISDCSVYVLPSYREGTPRTVLEAMAMGRAIITTDTPGCRQTVEHGKNGLLVPIKSVDSIVKAMEYFIENPKSVFKMGHISRLIVKERYDVNKVNALIINKLCLS
jgi:glycosyltransferase involved in cell wall biosynthesis